jgi:pimeloyl-ACP methyl ester carboxylesterase
MSEARNGDVTLFYETFGADDAPPLLLINGLGSQCINYRAEWCEAFAAAGFRVIRFDNRDVGLSTKFSATPPNVAAVDAAVRAGRTADVPYRLSDMAADAVAVLDAAGADTAHVFGVSMGGMIVQTLAIEHRDRLRTMTSVMSTTGDSDVGRPSPEAQTLIMSPPPATRDEYIERQVQASRVWGSPAEFDAARVTNYAIEAFDRCFDPAGQARQLMAIMASGSRTEALRTVDVPALIVHGDADRLVDQSGGRRTADAIPGARFVLLEGLGHDYPPAYWDRFVALVGEHTSVAL